jgi:hypothetical protein
MYICERVIDLYMISIADSSPASLRGLFLIKTRHDVAMTTRCSTESSDIGNREWIRCVYPGEAGVVIYVMEEGKEEEKGSANRQACTCQQYLGKFTTAAQKHKRHEERFTYVWVCRSTLMLSFHSIASSQHIQNFPVSIMDAPTQAPDAMHRKQPFLLPPAQPSPGIRSPSRTPILLTPPRITSITPRSTRIGTRL